MNVTFSLPVYRNSDTVKYTLDSLAGQSWRDFSLLVVYRSSDDDLMPIFESYSGTLDISVKRQAEGGFERALNMIFSSFSGDLLISSDADVLLHRDFVRDHVRFHAEHVDAGVATGLTYESAVDGSAGFDDAAYTSTGAKKNGSWFDRMVDGVPLLKAMEGYREYIADHGFIVNNPHYENGGMVHETIAIPGVNLSAKKETLNGFRLDEVTVKGLHNEQRLCLNAIKNGYKTAQFRGGMLKHLKRESLSRSMRKGDLFYLGVEDGLSPYFYSRYGQVNLKRLRLKRMQLEYFTVRSHLTNDPKYHFFRGNLRGIGIAIDGMEGSREPAWIGEKLRKIYSERNGTG